MLQENQQLWEDYRKMKKDGKPTTSELIDKEKLIKQSESRIENASFGIEHLFREVGHIYDAIVVLKLNPEKYTLPKVDTVANIFAMLVLNGLTFELLDGNSFYMPGQWIQLVLGIVHERIGKAKVLALSVLGLQSSGKSTLLNAMFGVQFSSSAGRCTRGIHSQLIPMTKQTEQNETPLFEYVLVIDTEGLRAPELSDRNYNRDNELATIITGLGDITMLNIMGENAIEIRDILQVIVHAFLRLKLANHRLDIRKSCILIHQNVADISASEKMKIGLELTVRNLDSVTRESAESEGISDITTFDQIIEFNTDRNVWYLPNLWKGNPPMAQINRKYSETVVSINHELLNRALNAKTKSFKSLEDIVMHADELWRGVLAEDFVFSFKNSIEKKAYVALEKNRKDKLRSLESEVDTELFKISQNEFSACTTHSSLETAQNRIITEMTKILSSLESKAQDELEKFFASNDYTDITIQWKEKTMNMLRELCAGMLQTKLPDIERMRTNRSVDILTNSSQGAHEEEFRKKSIELANLVRNKNMRHAEIEKKFEGIWNSFVEHSLKEENLSTPECSLKQNFVNCLSDFFNNHPVLYQVLDHYQMFQKPPPKIVSGSFSLTTISNEDISIKSTIKEIATKLPLIKIFDDSFKIVQDRLENFFKSVDVQVQQVCQNDIAITDREVRSFINDLLNKLEECMESTSNNFTLVISFNIKAVVHVCSVACHRFEEHNKEFQKCHGLHVRLAQYKKQCKERFYAHLNERNAESTGAALFRHVVEHFIRETVKDGISNLVKNALKFNKLPKTKYDLIIEMLTEMVRRGNFRLFKEYIRSPKSYAANWITSQSNSYLFNASTNYFTIASTEVNLCLDDIETGIRNTTEQLENSPRSIETWLIKFYNNLKIYKIPLENFRDVKRELSHLKTIDAGNFKFMLKEELNPVKLILLNEFKAEKETTVKWRGSNPYEVVITDIWGCPEKCVFCGEPCSECSLHPGSNHKCLQHRPKGCGGVHEVKNRMIVLTTCNYDVTQSTNASCSCFGYRCNPGKKEKCHLKKHSLSEYQKFIPDWDIKGINDAEERSKFWLWFIGKYKKELADHYNIVVSNVPSSWSYFSENDAIQSLRKTYPE
ncbi:interferon-induced very large GTPase 1-like [Mercenaria mercenaria]|uniref:interferon-induced very large GTPase 1-like n=1 Tax=Mercenaria mercenaria TaxID=6596 RepID=UPI00234E3A81|nr:interferon-induced very large GTPase 1-like [Mercenaria mercenaria]